MKTPEFVARISAAGTTRIEGLSDAIFAIVMTILVLELSVPLIVGSPINAEPTQMLLYMWPRLLVYGLSFLILGMFGLMHSMIFDNIKFSDTTLAWINIIFLMFVALIPFSTSLFGAYGIEQVTTLVYGCNVLLCFGLAWALWLYASGSHRLVDSDLDPDLIKGANMMGLIYFLITLFAISISFVNPIVSFSIYGLIVAFFIVCTMLGKWWVAMTFPTARKTKRQDSPDKGA